MIWLALPILAGLLWLVYRYSFLVPAPQGLPILMYHKISAKQADSLTVPVKAFERQLIHLIQAGYSPISFADLSSIIRNNGTLPERPVIITFDDGYQDTMPLLKPLLDKYGVKVTIFMPVQYIGGRNSWDGGDEAILDYEEIQRLGNGLIEFGLHSYRHENYEHYSAEQIRQDVGAAIAAVEGRDCPFSRVFAYPYGRMPKNSDASQSMRDTFIENRIEFALRIGSQINRFPFRDVYELKRTGIDGRDSFREFRIKVKKGRLRLF